MGGWIVNALEDAQGLFDSLSTGQVLLLFAVSLVLGPLSVLVHELGHALTARHYGADVHEVVASGEGPAAATRVGGVPVRLGLGLGRDLRSRQALGWVRIDARSLTPEQHVRVLYAGPAAQAAYGAVLLLAVVALSLPVLFDVTLALCGCGSIVEAALNLTRDGEGRTDGAKIRAIRAGALGPRPAPAPAPIPPTSPSRTATSVAPPERRSS